jgi:hypothetical protein
VDVVEVGPAHPPTALVTSEQMASEINRTGRIALYGLYFDTATSFQLQASRIDIKISSPQTVSPEVWKRWGNTVQLVKFL